MYIKSIIVNNYRILVNKKFEFSKGFNLIYGKNAQGKTSLIESVYFLASGKSFRTKKITEQIKEGQKRMTLFSEINNDKYAVELTKEKRTYYLNSEKILYKDYPGRIPIVSFTPEDMELIIGSPNIRRRFFNYEMLQVDSRYLKLLLDFQKILKNRNKLIKENKVDTELFDVYNKKYIELSVKILLIRSEYVEIISKLSTKIYSELFGEKKEIKIVYNSFIPFKNKSYKELVESFSEVLKKKKDMEKIYGYSIIGPQKDDFSFQINKNLAKAFASQGEKKSILLSLKLAQGEYILEQTNNKPIYLFDDIYAYFDELRKSSILSYLKESKSQCFFTSTQSIDIEARHILLENGDLKNE